MNYPSPRLGPVDARRRTRAVEDSDRDPRGVDVERTLQRAVVLVGLEESLHGPWWSRCRCRWTPGALRSGEEFPGGRAASTTRGPCVPAGGERTSVTGEEVGHEDGYGRGRRGDVPVVADPDGCRDHEWRWRTGVRHAVLYRSCVFLGRALGPGGHHLRRRVRRVPPGCLPQ